jgi:hypothetical protein
MMKKLLASLSAAAGITLFPSYVPRDLILSLRRRVPKNLGPCSPFPASLSFSIHLNIIISFRELGFQGISISLFSFLSLSLSL